MLMMWFSEVRDIVIKRRYYLKIPFANVLMKTERAQHSKGRLSDIAIEAEVFRKANRQVGKTPPISRV
jgi:hypothetical protein